MNENRVLKMRVILPVWMVAVVIAACGNPPAQHPPAVSPQSSFANEFAGAPAWVVSQWCDASVVPDPSKQVCGVGVHTIGSVQRMGLAQSAAQADGSAKVGGVLSKRVESLLKKYEGEWVADAGEAKSEFDAKTSRGVREQTNLQLSGVRPVATWISPSNNLYVLMVASPDLVRGTLQNLQGLNAKVKETIDRHADEVFQEMDAAR